MLVIENALVSAKRWRPWIVVSSLSLWSCSMFQLTSCAGLEDGQPPASSSLGVSVDLLDIGQSSGPDCMVGALCTVASAWGYNGDSASIQRELGPLPAQGYSMSDLANWADSHGFYAYTFLASLAILDEHIASYRPVIILRPLKEGNHAYVLLSHTLDGEYVALDPASNRKDVVDGQTLLEEWGSRGVPAILVARPAGVSEPSTAAVDKPASK